MIESRYYGPDDITGPPVCKLYDKQVNEFVYVALGRPRWSIGMGICILATRQVPDYDVPLIEHDEYMNKENFNMEEV